MKCRRFNSVMPAANHRWAAQVLGLKENPEPGPDLIGEKANVELKFRLVPSAARSIHWTILEHQMEYNDGKPCIWGLGTYQMDRAVHSVRTRNPSTLDSYVKRRDLYLVQWDWVRKFEPSLSVGRTETSEWNHFLRYPKFNALPPTTRTYEVENGLIHLTEGVDEELFELARQI